MGRERSAFCPRFSLLASGLRTGSEVQVAGIRVGRVNNLRIGPQRVIADFGVKDGVANTNAFVFDTAVVNVEGGGTIHTLFLSAGLVDEIHLVIAPFFVGDSSAPRFVHPGRFPQNPEHPMTLAEARQIGDVVLLRYLAIASGR